MSAKWSIYVDGSCLGNQNVTAETPAGWGVVVVIGDSKIGKGTGDIFAEFSGKVNTTKGSENYFGAEVGSNNTAELSAFIHALRWLLQHDEQGDVVIKADSQYAGNLACGAWKAKANKELVAAVRALWVEVEKSRNLSWEHVRAHRGHRWNERADHLALRAAQDLKPEVLSFWKPGQK